MLLAEALSGTDLSAGQLSIYGIAIVALGVMVKWWMRGTERSVANVAASVADLVKAVGGMGNEVARLDERLKQLRADHDRLHQWKNEFVEAIGSERKR